MNTFEISDAEKDNSGWKKYFSTPLIVIVTSILFSFIFSIFSALVTDFRFHLKALTMALGHYYSHQMPGFGMEYLAGFYYLL